MSVPGVRSARDDRPWWVAVAHLPGAEPRALVAYQAADAACAGEYMRAWLAWHGPEVSPAFVFVNGAPLFLYLPVANRPGVYQSRQVLAKATLIKERRLSKHRERWAKQNPPAAGEGNRGACGAEPPPEGAHQET